MNIWNILTADVRINPIASRHYFSKMRFAREDARVKNLPLQPLPMVQSQPPTGGAGPVLFAVADQGYFTRFATMFASSAARKSPQSAVHIHVLGDKPELLKFDHVPKHFSITYETADFSKMSGAEKGRYCQSFRFVRLAQFVKNSGRDYVAFDIDGLFQKSFSDFKLGGDVGLILRPEFSDPGLRVNAGVVYMKATAAAQKFMNRASTHMLRHVQHAPFIEKLDQRCLAMAMDENVMALPPEIYTFEPGQGYFYSAKGSAKNEELRRVFKGIGEAEDIGALSP
jgi:hypothetical protein